jgi:hypothetical protein
MSDEQLTTDDEKHAFCRQRGYPSAVFVPSSLYDAAEKQGIDMRYYVKQRPIPAGAK